jgi:CRP/FNR family transcriptional regulator, cyclic AMP receptor protein
MPRDYAHRLPPRPADIWRPVVDLAPNLFEWPGGDGPNRRLEARVAHATPGALDMTVLTEDPEGWIGLLILDGVLLVRLDAGRAHTGWLLGADDLLRPWEMDDIALTRATVWHALSPTRLALLDHEFGVRAGGVPLITRALVARTARTTNWLLAKSLVMASPLVEDRLLLAFALLGERWGTVNHDGVLLKLPLTHAVLATLCGVRRPSVTIALGALEADGVLARASEDAWLLRRHPAELLRGRPSCWRQYTDALGLGEVVTA